MTEEFIPSKEQRKVYGLAVKAFDELVEVEDLNNMGYKCPIYTHRDEVDAIVGDICLNNHAPYHVLEERLQNAITRARELGLGEDPWIKEVGELAFS